MHSSILFKGKEKGGTLATSSTIKYSSRLRNSVPSSTLSVCNRMQVRKKN